MKRINLKAILLCFSVLILGTVKTGWCEPSISTYTCNPIFQVNAVEPNIMIMLDNSSSMNFYAYGTWPEDGGIARDAPYAGEPYAGRIGELTKQTADDAEEGALTGLVDLNFQEMYIGETVGWFGIGGLRFDKLNIPRGVTVTKAYIEFRANISTSGPASFTIVGEATDDAEPFTTQAHSITDRFSARPTPHSVTWDPVPDWTINMTYQTPDLKDIVQDIIDGQADWQPGNAMAFQVVAGTGFRSAYTYDNGLNNNTNGPVLHIEYTPADSIKYYGYFNPDYFFWWDSNKFVHKYKKDRYVGNPASGGYWQVYDLAGNSLNLTDTDIVTEGLWDGNWMNWMTMRRLDVLRKVLVGGKMTARTGGGNETVYGEVPASSAQYIRRFDSSSGSAVSPYDGDYYYGVGSGYVYVDADNVDSDYNPFTGYEVRNSLAIQKDVRYEPEDFDLQGDSIAGILQRVGNKARWGNMWFNNGTGHNGSGGYVQHTIGPIASSSMLTDLQNTSADTNTPLAEAYYVAVQYFKQEDPENGLDYANGVAPHANIGDDPYYNGTEFVYCAKSFVLLLTDGASTYDSKVPDALKDYDGDGDNTACDEALGTNCDYPDRGTDYLDDIALYARTTDLRSATVGKTDIDGEQSLILYAVYAFGKDPNAENLLRDAAKNGGFADRNGNNLPDLQEEWDANNDGVPDTYYDASNGYELEAQLLQAINDILKRAASGTAVSVLATSGEGEGTLVQAYFKTVVPTGLTEVKWVGYLQSLWVDANGNLREDTIHDHTLNVAEDKIVSYFLDPLTGDTKIKRWNVSSTTPYPDTITVPNDEVLELNEITPIWEGAKRLAVGDPDLRNIFTFIDIDGDGIVDESTNDPDDVNGEIVTFKDTETASLIKPYLGVKDNATWSYLGATHDDRVTNLMRYIRGYDVTGLRTRTIDGNVWRLGDIVQSTPVSIASPPDNYHTIYHDESYGTYYNSYKNRETVVYVGANDGMLHAFTSGVYDTSSKQFSASGSTGTLTNGSKQVGDELWAYIPQTLLPHLKWLPDPDYTHVYYVDLKPKLFDAKIDVDGDLTPEWRTLLLLGLNFGGKHIEAEGDFDYDNNASTADTTRSFDPSYTCIDVTDPMSPRVLWERTYDDLQASASFPAVVRVGDKWFAIFGSGPSDCDALSAQTGKIYIVDLEDGEPYRSSGGADWLFETVETNAFMNAPVSIDKDLNFNVDAIYFGTTYATSSGAWRGKLYKVAVPWVDSYGDYDGTVLANYSDDPADTNPDKAWKLYPLFDAERPITSSVALSIDRFDNVWAYVGSGRYFNSDDKSNTDQQFMFGIKDPFFNKDHTPGGLYNDDYYLNYGTSKMLHYSDLLEANPFIIIEGGTVLEDTDADGDPEITLGSWNDLLSLARAEEGWYRSLDISGERILTKFAILGGIVFTPSFVPNDDICGFGGESYLYGQYFETGTAYYRPVFTNGIDTVSFEGQQLTTVLDKTSIGSGKASSIGVHVGKEGAKGFIQTSTGTVIDKALDPAFNVKSGLTSWIER